MRNQPLGGLATGTVAILAALVLAGGAAGAGGAVRPDDRDRHGPGATATPRRDVVVRPDDRADRRFPNEPPAVQVTTGNGFDWADAGIGAVAALGAVLLVAGGSVARLRHGAQTA